MQRDPVASVRRNVRLYYAYTFLMYFALWSGIWIKYLIEDRGFALRYLLLMDLPFWLLVALLQAPTGALADVIGRKRVMAFAGVLYMFTTLGFGFVSNYWMLFFDYVIWAFAQSMQAGADQALVYDSLRAAGREGEFSHVVGRNFSIQLAAGLASVVLGGFLADAFGMALIVKVSALAPAAAIAVAVSMHEAPHASGHARAFWRGLGDGLGFAWRHAEVRYTILIGSVLLAATFGPVVLVQPFLIHHDVSTALFGVYQAPLRLVAVIAALLAVRATLRIGVATLLNLAGVVIVVGYLGLGSIASQAAFAFFVLPSMIQGLTRPTIDTYLNDRIPSGQRATVLSVMQLCFALQVAFFEPALGWFTDGISLAAAFFFAACYFIVLMPPLLMLWRRSRGAPMAYDSRLAAAD
jgi:MFS family permease